MLRYSEAEKRIQKLCQNGTLNKRKTYGASLLCVVAAMVDFAAVVDVAAGVEVASIIDVAVLLDVVTVVDVAAMVAGTSVAIHNNRCWLYFVFEIQYEPD